MAAKKSGSLHDRMYGYQLSEMEKTLIFKLQYTGYVRLLERQKNMFYLDPSPFLPTPRYEIYVAQSCQTPVSGDLVKVTFDNTEKIAYKGDEYSIYYVKTCTRIDPNTLVKSRKLIDPEELLWYFKTPYQDKDDDLNGIALCSALSCLSAPPLATDVGGLNTAVFSDKDGWKAYNKSMQVIPSNLRRTDSPYYYKISEKDEPADVQGPIEKSYALHHPDTTIMHNPLTIGCSTKRLGRYREAQESYEPFVTAYMIDSVLFRPVISSEHDDMIVNQIYALKNLSSLNSMPCRFDLGTSIPRLVTSISRLYAKHEAADREIKMAYNLLEDMIDQSNNLFASSYPTKSLLKLESTDRKSYLFIAKEYGTDTWIPETEITRNLKDIKMTLDQYHESFTRLNCQGLIIKNNKQQIRLLEPVNEYLKRES